MKKVLSLVLVLVLCMAMSAMAATDSPTNPILPPIDKVNIVSYPEIGLKGDPAGAVDASSLVAKLNSQGKEAVLGADVAAMVDAVSSGKLVTVVPMKMTSEYDVSMGDVTITIGVPAAQSLSAGTKVAVAVAIPNGVADGQTAYVWSVFEGVANGNGGVETTLKADVVAKIAVGGAMVAIFA